MSTGVCPGSREELIDFLYDLNLQAGWKPSVRRIAALAELSHSTGHKALTRRDLPDLHVIVAIGLALADEVCVADSDFDRDAYLDGIDRRMTELCMPRLGKGRFLSPEASAPLWNEPGPTVCKSRWGRSVIARSVPSPNP
ncbi:hypothetical protein [Streptomyces sp. NRRL S-646]|uniref:hypothetical protein n=1 Tax=Streptomyces sp. NRRL S-646 TaxID=1463917 RepID=UPI001331A3E6|nr:hypothetical protein [Streptomyces sp. NRRL S-646]